MANPIRRFWEWYDKREQERREYEEVRIREQIDLTVRVFALACAGAIAAMEAWNSSVRDTPPSGAAR